ncbi:hypothetical protein Arth_0978 [Arthrobacter sp. FB24]|nr:hypothetical protein Arth_0978 [Arthrobacter sp. FB24]
MTDKHETDNGTIRRLGRAVVRIHQASPYFPAGFASRIERLVLTGKSMDFISRIHGFSGRLGPKAIENFATEANIGLMELQHIVLPKLKQADVADYVLQDGQIASVNDFLGLSGTLIDQTYKLLQAYDPTGEELALLHSVEVAAFAPLTKTQHLDQLVRRGFDSQQVADALTLSLALNVNQRVKSAILNEHVIFNPYVWGSGQVEIANFLRSLGPNERDVMLGICEQAARSPGLALDNVVDTSPRIMSAARKVGLIQATTVRSSGSSEPQTYIFSPTLELEDDKLQTTETLHQRKLFVAHILYGHEKAKSGGGRIYDPALLVQRLIERGSVGPATNIGTDYHLLEAQGIVSVDKSSGKAFLNLVKEEIAVGGLAWLEQTLDSEAGSASSVKLSRAPSRFTTPEYDRSVIPDDAAANEVVQSAVLRLREEVQRASRREVPFK